ncbi:phytoene desaturase family protein [Carboxylicivirga linearis]|uniref:Phytoene desaturase n=1 Tax=Carboxylicivirga linearis TaxID=1628157 RepID=A0ABS5JR01_9BACT|nr:phytoene desaturase family protein [Carboxylicivirga linearis]MBS2096916.1 phytoene desaturase [Carboxylicivirga linearis]
MSATSKKVIIVGAGFSSLSAACYLSQEGYDVTVFEKNSYSGGRAQQLKKDGFTFDMGPTFYWMPNVFESFFNDFNFSSENFYQLDRLDPAYEVYFADSSVKIANNFESIKQTFEELEPNSGKSLQKFINEAEDNYKIAIKDLVYQPGQSIWEIITPQTAKKLGSFVTTISQSVRKVVKSAELRKIMEFPVLFLGAKPSNTPAFYNFMNYADFKLGTWHPKGGMYEVAQALHKLALKLGVTIHHNSRVEQIVVNNGISRGAIINGKEYKCDVLLSGADYQFTEQLLPESYRQYSEKYWDKKTFAPSALLFYVAFDKKLKNLSHHTLFFDVDFERHAKEIYETKQWPEDPLFYASFPSITDASAAPEGKEAGIFLVPLAAGLSDSEEQRQKIFDKIISRAERLTKQKLKEHVLFKESYGVNDFISDYNSYKGNAYGLANTLLQTHVLRPKLQSKKVKNLYFTGQLTVPGPGIPPSLISGKVVSSLIKKYHKS